jgi:hypothetical protein
MMGMHGKQRQGRREPRNLSGYNYPETGADKSKALMQQSKIKLWVTV